ncbi:hypothetical protein UFOVP453_7 [uncultured Caudovirales phage]|uniref:Uncharacterized protein n=1 Tax=uncultured Caudovirales phage TaxID=2100421 RepID=A0A6J5MA36_9CAUD|nr:hypothetical protein UFOVP453_7 [uncultured Caudovirales phage]
MECPICGSQCEEIHVTVVEYPNKAVNFEDLANYLFTTLIDKGYAVNYDDINMILDIIDEYMIIGGEEENDETERS